ncbi:MAG TPA: twin-arginine translocation pathway signal, partial [Bacteroidia bacterium]|nr:twin-arginine translocation pathway signal [Bacteroidia bacterium]
MLRRDFLRTTGLASTALFLPAFLRGSVTQSFSGRRVIVIQLTGGNDGLNCIVPFRDDHYYSARPGIALRNNELLRLNDDAAFNINLRGLADLFHKGEASILSSVGYPNPNRSHFRSMDIWHSASDADRYVQTGWIGRYLDALKSSNATPAHLALELDESLSLALKGEQRKGMATPDSKRLQQLLKRPLLRSLAQASLPEQGESTFLYRTLRQTVESADYLSAHTNSTHTTGNYPNHAFGKQLRQIASLIGAGVETRFFYISP